MSATTRPFPGAIALAVICSIPAAAQTQQDFDWCNRKNNPSQDQVIIGCTALIGAGKLDAKSQSAALRIRGAAYLSKGVLEPSLNDLNQAIRRDPNSASAFYTRGDAYKVKASKSPVGSAERMRDAEIAYSSFTEAIRLSETPKPLYYINRSHTYTLRGNLAGTIGDLQEALRIDPADENSARVNLCRVRMDLKQYDAALADCTEFLRGNRDNSDRAYALNTRGLVYLKTARFDEALADYEEAMKLVDTKAAYHFSRSMIGRGIAKLKKGDRTGEGDISAGKRIYPQAAEDFKDLL